MNTTKKSNTKIRNKQNDIPINITISEEKRALEKEMHDADHLKTSYLCFRCGSKLSITKTDQITCLACGYRSFEKIRTQSCRYLAR